MPGDPFAFDPRVHEPPVSLYDGSEMLEPFRSRWASAERNRAWSARATILAFCATLVSGAFTLGWWP
jgi:hypothetical protein